MRRTRLAALAATALATAGIAIGGAAPASAFTNIAAGPVGLTTTSFNVGNAFYCGAGTMGSWAVQDDGPGAGGTIRINHTGSLSSCQAYGMAATVTLVVGPALTSVVIPASPGTATLEHFEVVFAFGLGFSCRYFGSMSGTYEPLAGTPPTPQTGLLRVSTGALTLVQAVGPACLASPGASGTFIVKDAAGNPLVV